MLLLYLAEAVIIPSMAGQKWQGKFFRKSGVEAQGYFPNKNNFSYSRLSNQ